MHLCPSSKNFTHSFEGVPHLDLGTNNAIKIPLKGNAEHRENFKRSPREGLSNENSRKDQMEIESQSQPCSDLPVLLLPKVREVKFTIALQVYSSTDIIKL